MRNTGTLFLLLVNFYTYANISDGADSSSVIYLNNSIVISAQRNETDAFDRSESVAVLNKTQLNKISPMSMPQALSYVPGVWMQKTNHGGGSAFIRGLTGYQTLLMIDGIRMNNSTYRSGPNQYLNTVDPRMISHVEVLRGSGSVQYGSDAVGGTIHMFSEDPSFSSEQFYVRGNIYTKYWSQDVEKTVGGRLSVGSKRLAFLGGFSYQDLGDIPAGGNQGFQESTGYNQYSMDFKAKYILKNNQMLTAAYQRSKQTNVPLYHKIVTGEYQLYAFDPQQRDLAYLNLNSYYKSKWASEIRYTLSYQNSLEVRKKQKTLSPEYTEEEDRVNSLGAVIQVISNINTNWKASSGIEFYHDYINSSANTFNSETEITKNKRGLYPDGSTYDNFALYSLHAYNTRKWNFSLGLRYNFIQLNVQDTTFGNTAIKPDALVWNVGAVYKLNGNNQLTANINSTFRAPNINDVSGFGIADFRFEIPSYDLEPETSLNKELGYKIRYAGFSAALSVFHNKLTNLIENVPADYNGLDSLDGHRIYKRENVSEAAIYGGELELEAKLVRQWVAFGNLSYNYGQNISDDEPMRRIPPFNGNAGIRGNFGKGFFAMAEWVFAAEQSRLSPGDISDDRIADGGTPGWHVFNIYFGYEQKYFNINSSIQNLTDTAYRVHGSGIDGIGLSFWVSLDIKINPK